MRAGGRPRRGEAPYAFLETALDASDADGFVHVGPGTDPDVRYLTGTGTDRRVGFGYFGRHPLLILPETCDTPDEFSGRTRSIAATADPARALAAELADTPDGTLLSPSRLPHDAALYVQREGFELRSTTAVADARAVKTGAELAAVRRTADAAVAGVARARDLLAATTVSDGVVRLDGEPLTADRLRREIDAELALSGVDPAGHTRVTHDVGNGRGKGLPSGAAIRIRLLPRDRTGYHAVLARTLIVEGTGGWERRAHVACEAARRVGIDEATPGTAATRVAEELLAELAAYGFDPGRNCGPAGGGVGLATVELPSLSTDRPLREGMVVSVTPTLTDPERGRVALADTVVVGADGPELLTDCSTAMAPAGHP